jgi:hypothetical protein
MRTSSGRLRASIFPNTRPMDLDRAGADAQVIGDHLVGVAEDELLKDSIAGAG